ncbi:MAG: hypothetical protein Q8O49_00450 [bacterium]|nr:hypothetical protein [bacterium]
MNIEEYKRYLKDNPEGHWFKAKLYGWGWMPVKWQGWVTILVFIVLIILNSFRLDSDNPSPEEVRGFISQTIILVLLLILICWKKGEKPRWQWGVPEKYKSEDKLEK